MSCMMMLARSLTHSHHIYLLQALSEAAGRARPLRHLSRLPPRRALRHQRQRRPDHQGVGVPLSKSDNLGGVWANIGTFLTHSL